MLSSLDQGERLRLLKFVCSFAWADLEVRESERNFVSALVERLGFDGQVQAQVREWLRTPPPPEEIDPTTVPMEHRKIFVETIEQILVADDEISEEERENLQLFKQLMA